MGLRVQLLFRMTITAKTGAMFSISAFLSLDLVDQCDLDYFDLLILTYKAPCLDLPHTALTKPDLNSHFTSPEGIFS